MGYDDDDEIESRKKCYRCTCCCGGALLFLVALLLGLSFSKVEYYEMGLPQRRTTGVVDKTASYASGNWYMGPDYQFITFPADVINVELKDLSAWTKASEQGCVGDNCDAGTSVDIDVSLQYRIILDNLPQLYEKRQANFQPFHWPAVADSAARWESA